MYPVIKASGAYSPGSAGTSSTVNNATARTSTYSVTIPATAKDRDILMVFPCSDSGLPAANNPVPSMSGHSFTFEAYCGGDSVTGLHGASYFTELQSDGAKTLTLTLPNGTSNTADSSVIWVLLDGSSVARNASGVFDPGWVRNSTQITGSTAHTISSQTAGDASAPSGNYLCLALLVNDANSSSVTYAYTAPSGWTKNAEVGSREYLDTAVFSRTFEGQNGFAAVTATYGASAVYTRMNVLIPGAPDFVVENVGYKQNEIASGGTLWCDKPAGAAADNEPAVFQFRGQSTTRQKVVIQRLKNVHPTRPISFGYTQGGNTTTTSTSHTSPALGVDVARAMSVELFTVSSALGNYTAYTPSGALGGAIFPPNAPWDAWHIYDNTATRSSLKTVTYSVAATWNSARLQFRAADSLATGVEVLVAFHIMDASQNGSLQSYPDWSGWIELGRTIRVSTAGAYNIRCYYKVIEAPKATVWKAGVDGELADTTGNNVGYDLPQTQTGSQSNPSNGTADAIPVQRAPGGRPGMASKYVIPANYTRLEQNPTHRVFEIGEEYYFSDSFYLDEDFPLNANSWQVVDQLHAAPGTGSPVVCFEVKNGQLRMTGGANKPDSNGAGQGATYAYDVLVLDNIEKYTWYNVVYFVRFSNVVANTRVDVWVNGVQLITNYQPPCATVYPKSETPNGGYTYRKNGIYHDKAIAGGTIWHGGSALGRSYAGVDPTRTLITRTGMLASDFATDPTSILPVRYGATVENGVLKVLSNKGSGGAAAYWSAKTSEHPQGALAWTSVSISAEKLPTVSGDGSASPLMLWVYNANQSGTNRVGFEYDPRDNSLAMTYQVGYANDGATVKITMSAATKFWRIRNTGAYIIWETSQYGMKDGWVEQRRMASGSAFNSKDASFAIETSRSAGADQDVWVDNLNVIITMLQRSGTATVGVNVGIVPTGYATRRGSAGSALGVTVAPSTAKTSRSPNIAPVTLGVQVATPIAGKYREGQTARTTLGVSVSATGSKRISTVTVPVVQRVNIAVLTGKKLSSGTAQVAVGVNCSVVFGQKQRRALTTLGVQVGVSTARTSRNTTAGVSMGVVVAPKTSYKSARGTAQINMGVEVLAMYTPPRKLYPEVRENFTDPQEGMRYYLQDVRSKEFIHTEFPLENEQITLSLSGPDIIQGDFGFDIRDVQGIGMDGWSQWIHAELNRNIVTSGLLIPWTYESRMNALEANGASIYPHGIPFGADKSYIQTDPMDIMADIWQHIQDAPMGNIGVRFIKSPTPVKLGTEEVEQVEFTAGGGGDSTENLDAMVTVKRESVNNDVWAKLKSMGYQETATGQLAQAAQEMYNRVNSGGQYYEDFSWTGMSANMARYNDTLADGFYARNKGNDVWRDRNKVKAFLQGVLAGGGTMSVKKRDLITAQGGTPGQTNTNQSGTGAGEEVSFEAGGPYKLNWFDDHDCGSKFDELIKVCPADYRENNYWDATRSDVKHDIVTGYPRLGRFLDEPTFTMDENIIDHVPLEEEPEDFATEIWVLGAGEGRDRIRGTASLTHPTRIRRVKVYVDKSITSKQVATALAKELLAAAQRPVSVKTVLINLSHDFAPLGSFFPGDDIKVQLDVRGYGEVDTYHRVEKMNWVPETMLCAVDLIRSDTIRYGVAAT